MDEVIRQLENVDRSVEYLQREVEKFKKEFQAFTLHYKANNMDIKKLLEAIEKNTRPIVEIKLEDNKKLCPSIDPGFTLVEKSTKKAS